MKFGGQSTTRAANSFRLLIPSLFKQGTGFFAPALCWCARTMVASIMTNSKSGSSAKALKRLSQTPLSDQRLYRWKTLFHLPPAFAGAGSAFRQFAPMAARARDPEHRINKFPIIRSSSARVAFLAGQQIFDPMPLIIPKFPSCHPCWPPNQ
jgi:hypothetical protein